MKSQLIAPTNFTMTTHNPIKAKRLIDVSVFYGNKIYFSIFVTLFASFFFRSTSYFMLLMVDYKIGADIPTLTAHLSYGKKPFLFELTDQKPFLRKKMRGKYNGAISLFQGRIHDFSFVPIFGLCRHTGKMCQ